MLRGFPGRRPHSVCLGLVALFFIIASPARAQDIAQLTRQCGGEHDETDDEIIAACTALIDNARVDPKQRSLAYSNRAYGYQGKGDLDRALADANEAIKLDPSSAKAFHRRGDVYKNRNQLDLALQDFTEAIRFDPQVAVFYVNRSNIYLGKHQYDLALRDVDEALRLDPSDEIQAVINRCNILTFKGELDAALADCRKGLQQHPKDPYPLSRIAFLYFKMDRLDDSISNYDAALAAPGLDPETKAYTLYGRGLTKRKKGDQAGGDADIAAAKVLAKDVALDFE
jgi:tetratricopeptide (TPR) repeat protein